MSRPNASEPSMDEILASIRKIIAEEPLEGDADYSGADDVQDHGGRDDAHPTMSVAPEDAAEPIEPANAPARSPFDELIAASTASSTGTARPDWSVNEESSPDPVSESSQSGPVLIASTDSVSAESDSQDTVEQSDEANTPSGQQISTFNTLSIASALWPKKESENEHADEPEDDLLAALIDDVPTDDVPGEPEAAFAGTSEPAMTDDKSAAPVDDDEDEIAATEEAGQESQFESSLILPPTAEPIAATAPVEPEQVAASDAPAAEEAEQPRPVSSLVSKALAFAGGTAAAVTAKNVDKSTDQEMPDETPAAAAKDDTAASDRDAEPGMGCLLYTSPSPRDPE